VIEERAAAAAARAATVNLAKAEPTPALLQGKAAGSATRQAIFTG
jgi:hypothetical protein